MAGIAYTSDLIGIRAFACPYANALEAELGAVLLAMRDAAAAGASRMVLVSDNPVAALLTRAPSGASPAALMALAEIQAPLERWPEWRLFHGTRNFTQNAQSQARQGGPRAVLSRAGGCGEVGRIAPGRPW